MKLNKSLLLLSVLIASCSGTEDVTDILTEETEHHAIVNVSPYIYDGERTRTNLTYSNNSINFSWDNDETIGVFPIIPYSGSQAYKRLERSSKGDGHVATFDGAGWQIRSGATYAAYYPYNGKLTSDTKYDEIPVDMTGQVQVGYNNLDHIGKNYDYMCTIATAPDKGDIVFNFKHVTSVVQLEVTLPEDAVITNVIIFDKQHETVFVDKAKMNICNRSIVSVHKSSMIELGVKNGTKVEAGEKVLLYVAMLPRDSRPVDITVETKDGKCYETSFTPKDMKAGYAYRWTIAPEYAGEHVAVDLGLPSGTKWATMNVGAKSLDGKGSRYFAWGETLPWSPDKENNYKYGSVRFRLSDIIKMNFTKYTYDDGDYASSWYSGNKFIGDGLTTLLPEDDAATQNWGSKWRMPTIEELKELYEECEWQLVVTDPYTRLYSTYLKVIGKNGNYIIMPFTGFYTVIRPDVNYFLDGFFCYQSSTLNKKDSNRNFVLSGFTWADDEEEWDKPGEHFEEELMIDDSNCRFDGNAIRPVCK